MTTRPSFLLLFAGAALLLAAPAFAEEARTLDALVVTRDASGLTLERYGVETVDDLVAISPGAFTASFYGVPGSVNLRGTLAEVYFRGFKRIENRGTYPTPLGATDRVEIVRGPPTAFNGPGKVGGFLNFVPKTARVEDHYLS